MPEETPLPNLEQPQFAGSSETSTWEPTDPKEIMQKKIWEAELRHKDAETEFIKKQEGHLEVEQTHTQEQTSINRTIKWLTLVMALAAITEAVTSLKSCQEPEKPISVTVQPVLQLPDELRHPAATPQKDSVKDSLKKK